MTTYTQTQVQTKINDHAHLIKAKIISVEWAHYGHNKVSISNSYVTFLPYCSLKKTVTISVNKFLKRKPPINRTSHCTNIGKKGNAIRKQQAQVSRLLSKNNIEIDGVTYTLDKRERFKYEELTKGKTGVLLGVAQQLFVFWRNELQGLRYNISQSDEHLNYMTSLIKTNDEVAVMASLGQDLD